MTNVMITGGAGFLGRYLAAALADWHHVTVLDDLSCANSTFDCPELKSHPGISCIKGSVLDAPLVKELVAEHPIVVHFASVVGVEETITHTVSTIENLTGTLNIAKQLRPEHVALFASSADVYGAHSHIYQRPMEEQDFVLLEDASINRWVYARVKGLEENLFMTSPARSVVIRVFNTYGPAMDFPKPKRVLPHFIDNVLHRAPLRLSGDGSQRRSFCYVDDTIRGVILALRYAASQRAPFSECFNLGATDSISMRELAEQVVNVAMEIGMIPGPLPIIPDSFHYTQRFDDSWDRVPNINHARQVLGHKPTVPFRSGLRRTLCYYHRLLRLEAVG